MNSQLVQRLAEFDDEIVFNLKGDTKAQTTDNQFSIGASEQSIEFWGLLHVREFILRCQAMIDRKHNGSPILFYSWLDEQTQ